MDAPTPTEARQRSALLTEKYPADDGHEFDTALTSLLAAASQLVASLTCRQIGTAGGTGTTDVPVELRELAMRAVVLKAEEFDVQWGGSAASRSKTIGSGNLASISAGPWSESYFGPGEAVTAQALSLDRSQHELLWALASEECKQKWMLLWTGEAEPAGAVEAFEYSQRPGGYPGGSARY